MALPIDAPLPIFYDRNGSVLDAGFVFIGAVNTNPETNPIPVFWDAAGTQPAPQPLRTVRGFIARNGAPAGVFVNSDYSIVVRDRNRQLVQNAALSSASLILDANIDRSVSTIAELRALSKPALVAGRNYVVTVQQHSSGNAKGGGQFRWDAASVLPDDNGVVINPTGNVSGGRWVRIYEGPVFVEWFGTTGVADNAVVQSVFNAGYRDVRYESNLTFAADVDLPSNANFAGNELASISWVSSSFNAFTATGKSNICIEGVVGSSSADSVKKPFISVVTCSNVRVHRCRSTNGLLFRSDSGKSYALSNDTNYCRDIRVTQCQYQGTRSIPGAFGAITLFYTIGALVQDNVLNGCPGGLQWWGGDSNDTTGQGAMANERKCRDIVVTGNKVNGCEAGLWGSMGDGVVVVGNRVTDCTDVGIDFEGTWNFTCSGNTVDGCKFACISSFFSSKNGEISGNQIKVTNLNPGGTRYGIWFTGLSTSIVRNINIDANNIVSELGASTVADLFLNDATLFCVNINIRNNTFVDGRAVIRRMKNPVFEGNKIYWPTVTANGNGIFADGNRQHRFDNNTFLRDNADSSPATDQAAIYLPYVDSTYNNEQYSCSGNRIAGWNTYAIYDQFAGAGQSFAAIVGNGVSGGIFRTGSAGVFKGLVSGNYRFGNPSIPVTATTY